jgi:(2Fe-2S) ferredoxin
MEQISIPRPKYMVFKCEQSSPPGMPKPSCVNPQTQNLFNHLAQQVMLRGLMGPVQIIRTSCLGRCQQGPVMYVASDNGNYMYVELTPEKIDRIIEEHFIAGNPVEEYLIDKQLWTDPE